MADPARVWGDVCERPTFVFTADQDWAPEWAVETFLTEVGRWPIPLHVFRTSPSVLLDREATAGRISAGWHPNFLPGSSHGSTIAEVIEYCRRHFPDARTVRSHAFAEDTYRWRALASAGILADAQGLTLFQGHLVPLIHWTGILRLPTYFEDDSFFAWRPGSLSVREIESTLFTPGLKVLNFHPTFVGLNTPSQAHYDSVRSRVFDTTSPADGVIFDGRGTRNVLAEVVDRILSAGYAFVPFEEVALGLRERIRHVPELCPLPHALGPPAS